MVPSGNVKRNGVTTASASGHFVNPAVPTSYATTAMTSTHPLAPNKMVSNQGGLLKVQTQAMLNRTYIKTEAARTTGYYCSSANVDSAMPGRLGNGVSFTGATTKANNGAYPYQNTLNHGGLPQWTTAPPSPYSSGSSSTSSYDALHVQFSPTEMLTSPFASPRDDNDYNHGNQPPLPGQQCSNTRHPPRSYPHLPPSFPQPFVHIPEIAPMGMIEELVPGMHHTSPITSRAAAGLTHL